MAWSFAEEDFLGGLRERDISVDGLADLTAKERSLLHQHADMALNETTRELVDALATQTSRVRG